MSGMRSVLRFYTGYICFGGCLGFLYGNYKAFNEKNITPQNYYYWVSLGTAAGFGLAGASPLLLPGRALGAFPNGIYVAFTEHKCVYDTTTPAANKH